MTEAIGVLNGASVVALALLMVTGRWTGSIAGVHHPTAALLCVVLAMIAQITAMFYLMGSGKEIREKVQACRLDPELQRQAGVWRRKVVTPAGYSLLALVGGAISGAAADTRVLTPGIHGITGLLVFGIVLATVFIQHRCVRRAADLLTHVRSLASAESGSGTSCGGRRASRESHRGTERQNPAAGLGRGGDSGDRAGG